jgi:hypothetical protein
MCDDIFDELSFLHLFWLHKLSYSFVQVMQECSKTPISMLSLKAPKQDAGPERRIRNVEHNT